MSISLSITIGDVVFSLEKLVKFNKGLWQIEKQGQFLLDQIRREDDRDAKAWAKKKRLDGLAISNMRVLGDYGRRDISKVRMVGNVFIVDGGGVRHMSRVRVSHHKKESEGFQLDWGKTTPMFDRDVEPKIWIDLNAEDARKRKLQEERIRANQPTIARIKAIPGWERKKILVSFIKQLEEGQTLSPKQEQVLVNLTPKAELESVKPADTKKLWFKFMDQVSALYIDAMLPLAHKGLDDDLKTDKAALDKHNVKGIEGHGANWGMVVNWIHGTTNIHTRDIPTWFAWASWSEMDVLLQKATSKKPTKKSLQAVGILKMIVDKLGKVTKEKSTKYFE